MEASPSSILEFHVMRKSEAGFGQFTLQARVPVDGFNFSSAAPPAISPSGGAPWGSPGLVLVLPNHPPRFSPPVCVPDASGSLGGWGSVADG